MHCTELDAANPTHWAIFPYALQQIEHFSRTYEPDRDIVSLSNTIKGSWVLGLPSVGIFVGHMGDKIYRPLTGHMFVTIEEDVQGKYTHFWQANVLRQYASDMRRGFMDACIDKVHDWSRARGIARIRSVTSRNPEPLIRRYGLRKTQTWMEMEVRDG